MQLKNSATQVDFYPCTPAAKRFVKRVIWHPGAESEMTSFSTVVKTDALYSISNLIANGAEVTDFNIHCYNGSDYAPVICLLYTSPSPRDGLLSRMPSSA